jgi:RNA polymerase sigma-70 factor (ECF subfamily)
MVVRFLRRQTPTDAADLAAALPEALRGNEDAFRMLYRSTQPALLRYLRVLVGQDAEDMASEAWLQIARDLPSIRGDGDGFRGWATTIARNRAMDHLRRQRRRPIVDGPVEDLTDRSGPEDTAESAVDAVDAVATDAALALIARLPRDQAEAVLLAWSWGWTWQLPPVCQASVPALCARRRIAVCASLPSTSSTLTDQHEHGRVTQSTALTLKDLR